MVLNPDTEGGWQRRTAEVLDSQATISTGFPIAALGAAVTVTSGLSIITGQVTAITFLNLNTTPAYIELFDTAGAVTLGTTTPSAVIPIPANATPANGCATVVNVNMKVTSGTLKAAAVTAHGGATPVTTGCSGTIWVK